MPKLPVTELKTRPLAAFQPKLFRKLIQGRGLLFRWSRAVYCTCSLNNESDNPDPGCSRCAGDGWQYVNPMETENPGITDSRDFEPIRAVLSNLALDPTIQQPLGGWSFSDGQLTVQQEIRVGFRDRWISVEHRMRWNEELIRGSADEVPIGKYPRTTAIQRQSMRYEPLDINWIASEAAGVQTRYYPGTDFTLTPAVDDDSALIYTPSQLVWEMGRGPSEGQMYMINYECNPVWVVDDATYSIQGAQGPAEGLKGPEAARMLPTTFKVRLDYLTTKRGS